MSGTEQAPKYERQTKWLNLKQDVLLLPPMVRNINTVLEADYVGPMMPKSSSNKKPSKKELANPGMIFLNISSRFLLYLIADHCSGDSGKTFVSRKTLLKETGMKDTCYDECIADLQASGLLDIEWEKFPGWWRRWWVINRERLAALVGPGVEPQDLMDAVEAAVEGHTAHVFCHTARIEPTKSRLHGLAKPARLAIEVTVIDNKATLTITHGIGGGPSPEEDEDDLSGPDLMPPPAPPVKQDAINPAPAETASVATKKAPAKKVQAKFGAAKPWDAKAWQQRYDKAQAAEDAAYEEQDLAALDRAQHRINELEMEYAAAHGGTYPQT